MLSSGQYISILQLLFEAYRFDLAWKILAAACTRTEELLQAIAMQMNLPLFCTHRADYGHIRFAVAIAHLDMESILNDKAIG